jgi:hypothetical protein
VGWVAGGEEGGCMDRFGDGGMQGRMDEWVGRWMGKWENGRMGEWIFVWMSTETG